MKLLSNSLYGVQINKVTCVFYTLLLIASALSLSCQAENANYDMASLCIAVNTSDEELPSLIAVIDKFSEANNLAVDKSHPLSFEYQDTSTREIISVISHMGAHGTIISFFSLEKHENSSLEERFKALISGEIYSTFEVKECSEIDGFRMPQIWE